MSEGERGAIILSLLVGSLALYTLVLGALYNWRVSRCEHEWDFPEFKEYEDHWVDHYHGYGGVDRWKARCCSRCGLEERHSL